LSVVAARGGKDIWIEIRRHRVEVPVEVEEDVPEPVPADKSSLRSPRTSRWLITIEKQIKFVHENRGSLV
jgi:hypothetical protein